MRSELFEYIIQMVVLNIAERRMLFMNLLYYSTQTQLAHELAQEYYKGSFYAYVAKSFNPDTNPTSSNPKKLYEQLRAIAQEDDGGSDKFRETRDKLRGIAKEKRNRNEITDDDLREIRDTIRRASPRDFIPLIYLIREDKILSKRLERVPRAKRASRRSQEYIIRDLHSDEFEIISGI